MKTATLLPGRILVTGSSGFIGTHTCASLRSRPLGATEAERVFAVDVLDRAALGALQLPALEAAVHLAGEGGPGTPWLDVPQMFRATVEACVNVLELIHPRRFVYTSSCVVYGTTANEPRPVCDAGLMPLNPYSLAKRMSEMVVANWASDTGTTAVLFRLGNIVGPGNHGLIEYLVRHAVRFPDGSVPATIRGGGNMVRDYVPIRVMVESIRGALQMDLPPGTTRIFNIGSGRGLTNGSVASLVQEVLAAEGFRLRIARDPEAASGEAGTVVLDIGETCKAFRLAAPTEEEVRYAIAAGVLDRLAIHRTANSQAASA